jgi:flagellar motor component MotA
MPRQFVLVHQALLATVIGKHGIFAQYLLTAPIASALRNLEAIIDVSSLSIK